MRQPYVESIDGRTKFDVDASQIAHAEFSRELLEGIQQPEQLDWLADD